MPANNSSKLRFLMAGGGTGGHVFPALAIANVLRERGHEILFVGTREGLESKLVPNAGYPMEYIRVGGLNRVSLGQKLKTAFELPLSTGIAAGIIGSWRPAVVFSMGGFVAGPVALAAILRRKPLVVMEPNALPGFTHRKLAPFVRKALVNFTETQRWFPPGKAEVVGMPVRDRFFTIAPKSGGPFTLLITGGSGGARTLNRASRESWPIFKERAPEVRILHQCGARGDYPALSEEFERLGMQGKVVEFIQDMPAAFSEADVVLARAGAGSVGEIAAAGMPSILVPLPTAADDHQRKNAEMLVRGRAAEMILDSALTGERLFQAVDELRRNPARCEEMRGNLRQFVKPGAAVRAAEILVQIASEK